MTCRVSLFAPDGLVHTRPLGERANPNKHTIMAKRKATEAAICLNCPRATCRGAGGDCPLLKKSRGDQL